MAIKVMKPKIERFAFPKELEEKYGDGGESTWVEIRQARFGENDKRGRALATYKRKIMDDGTATLESILDISSLYRLEIMLTLAGTNITDESGKPLFKFRGERVVMKEKDFEAALSMLPDDVVQFIHDKVIEVNPHWSPEGEEN